MKPVLEGMEKEIDRLPGDLCRNGGFCLPPDEHDRIVRRKQWEATEFALAVVRAEGFPNPEYELFRIREVKEEFTARFGTSRITAADFERGQIP